MIVQDGVLTRRFAAGAATFVVRCPTTAFRDLVERIFSDLPLGSEIAVDAEVLVLEDGDGNLMMRFADRSVGAQSPNATMARLVTLVSRLALDTDPGHLHLHCAALSLDGHGVLISAPSGTGKTTLAAALAMRGWTYLSDEVVSLSAGSYVAHGFSKPLLIKPGGGSLVPELETARVPLAAYETPWWLVPVSAIPAPVESELTPTLIVILYRAPDGSTDADPVPLPIHPTDAVVALMEQTMDAERFGPTAISTLGGIAAGCRCVSLPVGPLNASVSALEDLIRKAPQISDVRCLAPPSEEAIHGWKVMESIRSVIIGDRAVLHDTNGGAVLALDEAGTGLWRALHGEAPDWWQPETMWTPSTDAFLEQLSSHGLVARALGKEPTRA